MNIPSRTSFYLFLVLALFSGSGCGSNDPNLNLSTPSGETVGDESYSGAVSLGRPIEGATVVAQTLEGTEIARTTTSA